jgi:hypothetical protein
LELEKGDELEEAPLPSGSSSNESNFDQPPPVLEKHMIRFEADDPEQPNNWSQVRTFYGGEEK